MIAEHIGARSDKGPFRSTNQDAYWVSDTGDPIALGELYIVTDGVGGQEYGAAAAQLAAQAINTQFYRRRQAGEPVAEALGQAIYQANEAVYQQAQERGGVKMGCTVVAAVQHEGLLYVAHVGDARVYLLHKNKLRQLTRDDSWVQKQIDAGIITPEEAENHQMRNVVTQALGNNLDITVHQSQHENFRSGDRLLLCTDGLHGVLSDAEISKLLKNNPPQTAADKLVQAAIDAGTQDNVTAVVVQLQKSSGAMGATAVSGSRRPVPLWAIVTLITLALLALAWGIYAFWPASDAPNETAPGPNQRNILPTLIATAQLPAAGQPTAVPPTDTTVPPAEPTATETPLPPTATPTSTDTATPPPRTAVVQSEAGVNLRPFPGADNQPLGILPDGTLIELLPGREKDDNQLIWQQVRVPDSGQEGWVAAIYLKNNE
ncbi:MAG TPA: hypothetical protein EYH05_00095 [Anaerolineae bacterium]|nr:hypothetical protein [Anaerolineae bacterium]